MSGTMPLPSGTRIGSYEVETLIGSGGMGEVYRARDSRLERLVALKVLVRENLAGAEQEQFLREAKAVSTLNHPNIVHLYDLLEDSGRLCLVMEYLQGQTLANRIPGTGMPVDEAVRYGLQITKALAAAHAAGVVHRDVKPGNVLVCENGTAKLLDFGVAKVARANIKNSETALAQTADFAYSNENIVVGTLAYMSPEQAEGRPVDARTDIFSFGSLLYARGSRRFKARRCWRHSAPSCVKTLNLSTSSPKYRRRSIRSFRDA
jgi:serine/threonine-protein kinase